MIDTAEVLDLIDHLVETHGTDYVAGAAYVHEMQPECGVAKVLHLMGVPVDLLLSLGRRRFRNVLDIELGLHFTLGARIALVAFQDAQDKGTWGEARVAAYKGVRKVLDLLPDRVLSDYERELVHA